MTSYVMCNKKKLGIKKSDIECLKKSVKDRKLEYFKSELLKILDKKEVDDIFICLDEKVMVEQKMALPEEDD